MPGVGQLQMQNAGGQGQEIEMQLPPGWINVPGCYMGPPEGYQSFLDASCLSQFSSCPCPERPQKSVMPQATTAIMPSMTNTAIVATLTNKPEFTPKDLLKPMPSIVNTAPVQAPNPCDGFSQWVSDNPLMAAGLLAGLAWFMFKGKG